jgi:hypothetical protein
MKKNILSMEAAVSREPTLLETVRDSLIVYKGTVGTPMAITDIGKIARIEPITVIDKDLIGIPELQHILHGVLNLYTAFYLQAVSILSADLQDVRILKILDKTNPDRDLKTVLTSGYTSYESYTDHPPVTLSLESCKYKLPTHTGNNKVYSKEDVEDWPGKLVNQQLEYDKPSKDNVTLQKVEYLDKLPTAVGKVIEVKFSYNNATGGKKEGSSSNTTVIPVVVRLDTMLMTPDVLKPILTANEDEIKFSSRFADALRGRISFIKDFILCSDLIKAQKKTMMKDPSGIYTQILKRINSSRAYSALTGNISMAAISSIFVISAKTEKAIKEKIGGDLTNKLTRKIVFDNISAMCIVVVDDEWEMVSIYIRDMDSYSQNSFNDFKVISDKASASQITDMLKAFSIGQAPSF